MVLASLALGAASYRYIEQPVRIRRDFWTHRRLLAGSGVSFALLAGFVSLAFLNHGFPTRLPEYLLPAELARRTNTPRDECFRNANSTKNDDRDLLQFRQRRGRGKAVRHPVGRFVCQSVSRANFFGGARQRDTWADRDAKRVPGLRRRCGKKRGRSAAVPGIQSRAHWTSCWAAREPSIVVLGSNWEQCGRNFCSGGRLLSAGKTVVLIMPLLNIGFDLPQRWIENQIRAGGAIDEWKVEAGPGLTKQAFRNEIAQILDKHRENPRLITVDPLSVVCEQGYCYLVRNGQANFRDTAHISNVNASQYRERVRRCVQVRATNRK